jgi:hypothetical protein
MSDEAPIPGGFRQSLRRAFTRGTPPTITPWEAVERDDLHTLKEWTAYRSLSTLRNENMRTLLHVACGAGATNVVHFLVTQFRQELDINEQGKTFGFVDVFFWFSF